MNAVIQIVDHPTLMRIFLTRYTKLVGIILIWIFPFLKIGQGARIT
jgi:hypothetical protein